MNLPPWKKCGGEGCEGGSEDCEGGVEDCEGGCSLNRIGSTLDGFFSRDCNYRRQKTASH
jgi:hypothetical protein